MRAPCLESPAGGELGGGESDGEGGIVEGDVGDDEALPQTDMRYIQRLLLAELTRGLLFGGGFVEG